MEEINTNNFYESKKQNSRYDTNINSKFPNRLERSFDNTLNRNLENQNFTSYNITTDNNKRQINLEKYNNISPINQTSKKSLGYTQGVQCSSYLCPYLHHCNLHHIHFHHIHIPHSHFCPRLHNSSSFKKVGNQQLNNDLINEVAELRNECRKFKEELEKTKNENEVGNKYIKLLENKINSRDKKDININMNGEENFDEGEDEKNENIKKETNLENRYHNMLDRSFEVLNSVSNKCDDNKGKMKGDLNYYVNKDPDYDELIEAQKKWLDNLPEKYFMQKKIDILNYNNNSTYSNTNGTFTKERFNEENIEENDIFNDNENYNEKYYNNMSNFNKNRDNKFNNNLNINKNNKDSNLNLDNPKFPINQIKQNYKRNYNKDNINNIDKDINKKNKYNDLNIFGNAYKKNNNKEFKNIKYNNNYIPNISNSDSNKNDSYQKNKASNDLHNYNYKKNKYKDELGNDLDNNNNFNYLDYKNNRNNIPSQNQNIFNNDYIEKLNPNIISDNNYNSIDKENKFINNDNDLLDYGKLKNDDNSKKPSLNANDINISNNNKFIGNTKLPVNANENQINNNYINNKPINKNKNKGKNIYNNQFKKFEEDRDKYVQEEQEQDIEQEQEQEKNNIQNNYPQNNIKLINDANNKNYNNINENNNNFDYIQNNNMNNLEKESQEEENEDINPLNERYLIIDENNNPITIGGQQLLGMELIPMIGEDGKEELDEHGNIILIGPDGQPKTQDELDPILLDDEKPLVNEENRPFLGINGVPLINGYGNPVLGPGELYDRNNQVVIGVLGILPKDKMGNPVKVMLNENEEDKNDNKDENEAEEEENNVINNNDMKNNSNNYQNNNKDNMNYNNINQNNENENNFENNDDNNNNDINNYNLPNNDKNNLINVNNLRPLLGPYGNPIKDAENNYVLLDENNKPVKNTGITLLLDQTGKPVLNSKLKPILIDAEGKPINLEDNNNIENNPFLNPDLLYGNEQDLMNKQSQKKYPQQKELQRPIYQKINSQQKEPYKKNQINKGYIKHYKKPKISDGKNKKNSKINDNNNNYNNMENKNRDNYKQLPIREIKSMRNKRDKGRLNYSECSPDSVRKINFMGHNQYKGACFACDVGCSISRSGYSPMNYSPYNNLIKRREVTPLKNREIDDFNGTYNLKKNKNRIENDNNYYLTEV